MEEVLPPGAVPHLPPVSRGRDGLQTLQSRPGPPRPRQLQQEQQPRQVSQDLMSVQVRRTTACVELQRVLLLLLSFLVGPDLTTWS